jgi:hypothetical protein
MCSRILSSIITASALVTAAPVLANEPVEHADAHPPSCDCAAVQTRERHGSMDANEKQNARPDRAQKTTPRVNEDPFVWDPSWGG